jgi:WD40 repeat protein
MMDGAQALARAARCAKAAAALCGTLGLCLAAGSGRGAEGGAWKIDLSRTISLSSYAVGAVWSPDGKRLASMQNYGQEISIWTADGARVTTFSRHEGEGPQGGQCLAFLPDGKTLIAPGPTDTPEHRKSAFGLWDTETGALERLIPGPDPDSDDSKLPLNNSAGICALSPDGALVAMRPRYPISPVAIYSMGDWHILGVRKLWLRDVPIRWPDSKPLRDLQNSPAALALGSDNALSVGAMGAIITFGSPFGSSEPSYIATIPSGDLNLGGPAP